MASEKLGRVDVGKVMVIGGCGFLGHHIVNLLLRDYACSVSVVDLRCSHNRRPDSDGVKYVEADITDATKIASVFDEIRPEAVIHTASPAPQSDGKVHDALYKKVNVDGTQVIVDACKKFDVKVLIYTSSASVASDNVHDLINADERWPVPRGKHQSEYYSETKARTANTFWRAETRDRGSILTV
jgi:sterol-4alpha-carboxylate 3-dehydrogenase (decarboxylating)